jgi:hypothetical protein
MLLSPLCLKKKEYHNQGTGRLYNDIYVVGVDSQYKEPMQVKSVLSFLNYHDFML